MPRSLPSLARQVAELLQETEEQLVLAESCTAGLVGATIAQIPGISAYWCGSAVTYQNDTKAQWLKVDPELLRRPGPVSEVVARQMAEGVLRQTPHATLSAAITGHLGPNAPARFDGVTYIGIARRSPRDARLTVVCQRCQLESVTRLARQREAVHRVLQALISQLASPGGGRREAGG